MFAIKAPQTVTLNVPGEDRPDATINFKTNDADSSRCVMEVIYPDGEVHKLTFNTRGSLIDSIYTVPTDEPDLSEEERRNEAGPTSHMVDGRDMRAFDPYEYKPPITDADAAYRDPNAGFTAPQNAELREQGEKDRQEAAERAKDLRQEAVEGKKVLLDQPDPGLATSSDFSVEPVGTAAEQRRADRSRNTDAPTAG